MRTFVVLAMHGIPPRDFPRAELAELSSLHRQLERATGKELDAIRRHHDELDHKVRNWPRTEANDPFFFASQELGARLASETGFEVVVGFNEFCAPTVDHAIDEAVAKGAERVVVVTPMMTSGGRHAEEEIPAAISRARERHAAIEIDYAWPFDPGDVARFLAKQIERFPPDVSTL